VIADNGCRELAVSKKWQVIKAGIEGCVLAGVFTVVPALCSDSAAKFVIGCAVAMIIARVFLYLRAIIDAFDRFWGTWSETLETVKAIRRDLLALEEIREDRKRRYETQDSGLWFQ